MKSILLLIILSFIAFEIHTQELIDELRQYENHELIDEHDTTCHNIKGEWKGLEIAYDQTKSFIRSKYKMVFNFEQVGNRISGTSYFEREYKGSYGEMKIRGIIIGDKLHFEEYELIDEEIQEKNTIWCFTSGEMKIKTNDNEPIELTGLYRSAYDVDYFQECTGGYSEFFAHRLNEAAPTPDNRDDQKENTQTNDIAITIFPNPMVDQATVRYNLFADSDVRIGIYDMSGTLVQSVFNTHQEAGDYDVLINSSTLAAGVYILVIQHHKAISSKQFIKTL